MCFWPLLEPPLNFDRGLSLAKLGLTSLVKLSTSAYCHHWEYPVWDKQDVRVHSLGMRSKIKKVLGIERLTVDSCAKLDQTLHSFIPFDPEKKGDLFPNEAVFHDAYKQHETIVSWKSTCKYLLYCFKLADIHINSNMGVEWNGWNLLNNIIFNCGYKIIWKKYTFHFNLISAYFIFCAMALTLTMGTITRNPLQSSSLWILSPSWSLFY